MFLSIGKSLECLSCTSGMKKMEGQHLEPSETLALTSMKVLEVLGALKMSQSVETHMGGTWEDLKEQRTVFSSLKH